MILARRWLWGLLLVIAAAAVYLFTRPAPVLVDVAAVKREDVQLSVVASGRVLAPARVDIGATITGRVQKVAVREGASVQIGRAHV